MISSLVIKVTDKSGFELVMLPPHRHNRVSELMPYKHCDYLLRLRVRGRFKESAKTD